MQCKTLTEAKNAITARWRVKTPWPIESPMNELHKLPGGKALADAILDGDSVAALAACDLMDEHGRDYRWAFLSSLRWLGIVRMSAKEMRRR